MQFLNQSQSDIYLYFPATLCPLTLFSYVWGIKQVLERSEHKSHLGVGNKWFSYYWHTRSESNPIYSFLALLVPLHEHWKTLPHIPKPQTTSFSLGLKPAFPLINFQTTPHLVGSDWCLHQIWISSCVCTAAADGKSLSSPPPKNQKIEAKNRYSYRFGGQGVSLHTVCRLRSGKQLWHRHLLCPLMEWFFSMIHDSVSYPATDKSPKVMGDSWL